MFYKLFDLLFTPKAIFSLLTWKKFSLAALKIANRLQELNVEPVTIVDIGANSGQFSTAVSHLLRPQEMIIIEANPGLQQELYRNLSHIRSKEILITGIGNFDGQLPFNFNVDSQVSSFLSLGVDRLKSFPESVTKVTETLPIAKLDTLFASRGLLEPILLKIDVQGLERDVIEGGEVFLKSVKWLLIETSFAQLYKGEASFPEMLDILKVHGFEFVGAVNYHEDSRRTRIIEMDALFQRATN